MPYVRNLDAVENANMIGDNSTPTLTLDNLGTAPALVVKSSTATGTSTALRVEGRAGTPTVAPLVLSASTASGALVEFRGYVASIASVGSITRGVRAKIGDTYYWIPLYQSATFI